MTLATATVLFAQAPDHKQLTFALASGATVMADIVGYGNISLLLLADELILDSLAEDSEPYKAAAAAAHAAAPAIEGHVVGVAKSQSGFVVELNEILDLKGLAVDLAPFMSPTLPGTAMRRLQLNSP